MKKVFVYGTLMKGFGNNRLLENANYLGQAVLNGFGLYCVTSFFPGIIERSDASVIGEIYQVDEDTLLRIDQLEGAGTLYIRKKGQCVLDGGVLQEVIYYIWNGKVMESDYIPVDFLPWHPDVASDVERGIGRNYFYLFAYGRYCNIREVEKLVRDAGVKEPVKVIGVGILKDHRLAFTRKKSGNPVSGALDIIASEGDYALGVIYRMPKGVEGLLNRKEGAPTCYIRDKVQLRCGDQTIYAQAYFVVNKHMNEVKPDEEYYETVLQGMRDRYPVSYINKYFIEHCNQKFSMSSKLLTESTLYHDDLSKPLNQGYDDYLYRIINQMAIHLGNDNKLIEGMKPTPEILRILVKLVDMQGRDVIDYGHIIPRSLANRLAAEFERMTGRIMERLPEY